MVQENFCLYQSQFRIVGAQLLDNGKVKEAVYESKNLGFSVMVNDQKIQNSSDLLMSSGMETFLEEMRNTMDLIIIDAPYVRKRSDIDRGSI